MIWLILIRQLTASSIDIFTTASANGHGITQFCQFSYEMVQSFRRRLDQGDTGYRIVFQYIDGHRKEPAEFCQLDGIFVRIIEFMEEDIFESKAVSGFAIIIL